MGSIIMPKVTPVYSAFAIVAIESIWPSSQGDEVPINYQDLVLLNERLDEDETGDFWERQNNLVRTLEAKNTNLINAKPSLLNEIGTSDQQVFVFRSRNITREIVPQGTPDVPVQVMQSLGITERKRITSFSIVNNTNLAQKDLNDIVGIISNSNTSASNIIQAIENLSIDAEFNNEKGQAITRDAYFEIANRELQRTTTIINNENYKNINNLSDEIKKIDRELLDRGSYGTYPQSVRRPGFSSILSSEDAYKKRRGYFKIIPLNIIQVATSTSTGGMVGQSSFNASFTMDDLLIIADVFAAEQIETSLPRAIPIKIDEVFDELNRRINKGNISQKIKNEVDLFGMYAFRISGNDFTFNIEDLVEANDTATIWIYHDPKEFDFVNKVEKPSQAEAFETREIEYENEKLRQSAVESVSTSTGYFLKRVTYRTINEGNENVLEVFLDSGVYVERDDADLLLEINNSNQATLDYLEGLSTADVNNFDRIILRIKTGVSIPPSMCTPANIADYESRLALNPRSIAGRFISGCFGVVNTQVTSISNVIAAAQSVIPQSIPEEVLPEERPIPEAYQETPPATQREPIPDEDLSIEKFVLDKDFSYVIGSGSRKSQDDFKLLNDDGSILGKPPRTLAQSIFVKTGILNEFSNPEALAKNENRNVRLTNSQVFSFLVELGREAALNPLDTNATRERSSQTISTGNDIAIDLALDRVITSAFPNVSENNTSNFLDSENLNSFLVGYRLKNVIKSIYLPNLKRYNEENKQNTNSRIDKIPESALNFSRFSQGIISSISNVLSSELSLRSYQAGYLASKWSDNNTSINNIQLSSIITEREIEDIFQTIIDYRTTLQRLADESLAFMRDQNSNQLIESNPSEVSSLGFFNQRTYLKTNSHGETPYLAVKGHISSLEVKYGASQGSHIITLTGSGYEKILNDNIVYYEDLFAPTGGTFGQAVEAYPIYSQMFPPKALLSFIETNAPRFILVGKPSRQIVDARTIGLGFAKATRFEDEDSNNIGLTSASPEEPKNVVEKYFPGKSVLVRGLATFDINITSKEASTEEDSFEFDNNISLRVFYPVNYLNTSRIREMINSLEAAYAQNPEEAVIKIPIKLAPMQSIANNLMAFNGPKEVNHLFVDETGRLRQRLAYEAWERPPAPEYTPIITDKEILVSGASFSKNSDAIATMVDIRANYLTTGSGLVNARFAGRTLSGGNDYIPLLVINNSKFNNSRLLGQASNFYEVISEPFFRYGMKYRLLNDVYTTSTRVAKRKSILYQSFFSKPLKTAKLTVRGSTSYRAGETVFVCLDSYKYRSQEIIDVRKTLEWLNYIKLNKDLIPLYIGADSRWANNDSYFMTSNLEDNPKYSYWLPAFKENPELFVLDAFIYTFEQGISNYLNTFNGTENNYFQFITPEYFPTTFWASEKLKEPISSGIENLYSAIFEKILRGNGSSTGFENLATDYYEYIRMQNFKATSYYIEAAQQTYVHGEQCVTGLTLNHGQDNLVLLEPFSMKPIGFMSIERKMRIGYDDVVINKEGKEVFPQSPTKNTKDRMLWEEFPEKMSDLQSMYIEQFKQDTEFKKNSFLYSAQKYRNSSNFMYELALELGLVK
jgi:hypothetical protein